MDHKMKHHGNKGRHTSSQNLKPSSPSFLSFSQHLLLHFFFMTLGASLFFALKMFSLLSSIALCSLHFYSRDQTKTKVPSNYSLFSPKNISVLLFVMALVPLLKTRQAFVFVLKSLPRGSLLSRLFPKISPMIGL